MRALVTLKIEKSGINMLSASCIVTEEVTIHEADNILILINISIFCHGKVKRITAKLELEDLDLILRERRLCWFGHVERSSGAIRTACDIQIDGRRGAGRPKLIWKKLTERDCREWKLTTVDPQDRSTWRSGARSVMYAASQLPGEGPTDVDDAPAH